MTIDNFEQMQVDILSMLLESNQYKGVKLEDVRTQLNKDGYDDVSYAEVQVCVEFLANCSFVFKQGGESSNSTYEWARITFLGYEFLSQGK